MLGSHSDRWLHSSEAAPGSSGTVGRRARAAIRAACTPANLLLGAVVAFGWLALIGWTGAGPDGWQARICADLDLQPRACSAIHVSDDTGRAAGPASSAS